MILGFAHITRNATDWVGLGIDLPNAPEKWPLMQRQASHHRLRVSDYAHGVSEEVVAYNTKLVEARYHRLDVVDGKIVAYAQDTFEEAQLFCDGLGFKAIGRGVIELASQVPQWGICVKIQHYPEAGIDPPLDIAGYAALAFYSSDVEADRDHLLKHGGRTPTEPFTVKLDREMKIVMLRSPEGTIIELIQVMP